MARARTPEEIRRELETERRQLAASVDELRGSIGRAADVSGKLRANLPVVAGAAASAGFVLAGGVGATLRYLARRGREPAERVRVGRFSILDRD